MRSAQPEGVYIFYVIVLVAVGVPCARTARALGYCAYTYYNDESRETEWSTEHLECRELVPTPHAQGRVGAKKPTQWEDREWLGWHEGRSL